MVLDSMFKTIIDRQRERGLNFSEESLYVVPLDTKRSTSIIFVVFLCISIVMGLVGNTMIFGAVAVSNDLKKVCNFFIVNLAIADTMIITIAEPFHIVGIVKGPGFFVKYPWLCHGVASVCLVACVASIFSLTLIAVNRMVVITKYRLYMKIFTPKKSLLYCLLTWILAILIDLPNFVGWGGHMFDLKASACGMDRLAHISYIVYLGVLAGNLPLVIIIVCYVKIYLYVRKKNRAFGGGISDSKTKTSLEGDRKTSLTSLSHMYILNVKRESQPNVKLQKNRPTDPSLALAKTFLVIIICFFAFLTPFNLSLYIDRADNGPDWLYKLLVQIYHFNSSTNALVYGFTNKQYREGFKMFLRKIFRRK